MEQRDKTEIEQSETPEALYSAIEKYSAASEDLSRESAYREARNALIRFRKVYSKLPALPNHQENVVAGLQEIMDWCVRAIDIVGHMVDDMDRDVIEGFICKLNKLKGLPASGFPKVDNDVLKKAKDRAQRIVDKYQAGKKPSKRLSIDTYCFRLTKFSKVEIIISRLVEVANRRTKEPDKQGNLVGGKWIPVTPLDIDLYHAHTEMDFIRAIESIYRLMDSKYTTALAKLEEKILIVFEEWNKLNDTDTGGLLDKYDELKGLKIQDRVVGLARAYSIDSIVDTALFGPNQGLAFRDETRETLVDGLVETLGNISRKIKASVEQETQNMIKLFISHSSKDQKLVEELTELVKNALRLSSSEIRCTTVDGYRLPGGAKTNEQLKREVCGTKAFIGLISFAATDSMYVLFELGARWGSDKHLLPLLAPGVSSDILKGPLSDLNALSCGNVSQLHQLVKDLAEILEIESEPPQAYQRYIDGILAIPPSEDKNPSVGDQVEAIPACKPTDVQIRIMKAVADMNRREATVANIARVIGLSDMEAKYNLDELAQKHELLDWTGNMNPDVPDFYTLTHKGRGFVLSQRDS